MLAVITFVRLKRTHMVWYVWGVSQLCAFEKQNSMQKNTLLLGQVPESLCSFAFKANVLLAAKKLE